MNKLPSKDQFDTIKQIVVHAYKSGNFSKTGNSYDALMGIAIYAFEVGIGTMEALTGGVTNIQGNITMSPELMNRLIRENGHTVEIVECTKDICRIKGTRKDTKETFTAEYTIAEAQSAGLVKAGGAWTKYPSDMLFARCISRLRRRLFTDVASRAYTTGEIEIEGEAEDVLHEDVNLQPPREVTDDFLECTNGEMSKILDIESLRALIVKRSNEKPEFKGQIIALGSTRAAEIKGGAV